VDNPSLLWNARIRSLEKARRALRDRNPEALHDFRVSLRRLGATARALGRDDLEKTSRRIVRTLSPLRQLEVDRALLARISGLGLLSSQLAAGLDARWEERARQGERESARRLRGKRMKRLRRKLSAREKDRPGDLLPRLLAARRQSEETLRSAPDSTDRALHRYRLAVKRARYLAEDLALSGERGWADAATREKRVQEILGRWNDVRLFRERLIGCRREAEVRGSITLASELDRLIPVLTETVESARRDAENSARSLSSSRPVAVRSA